MGATEQQRDATAIQKDLQAREKGLEGDIRQVCIRRSQEEDTGNRLKRGSKGARRRGRTGKMAKKMSYGVSCTTSPFESHEKTFKRDRRNGEGGKRRYSPCRSPTHILSLRSCMGEGGASWEIKHDVFLPLPSSVRYGERDLSSILLASCSPHAHGGCFTDASPFLFREGRKTSFPICNLPWTKKKKGIGGEGIGGITLRTRKGGRGRILRWMGRREGGAACL